MHCPAKERSSSESQGSHRFLQIGRVLEVFQELPYSVSQIQWNSDRLEEVMSCTGIPATTDERRREEGEVIIMEEIDYHVSDFLRQYPRHDSKECRIWNFGVVYAARGLQNLEELDMQIRGRQERSG